MKNKFINIFLIAVLCSSLAVFATDAVYAKKTTKKPTAASLEARTKVLEGQVSELRKYLGNMYGVTPIEMYAHGPAVVVSPAFGLRGPDSHELMVNLSNVNKDLYLLRLRQKMENYADENNIPLPTGPMIVLSGGIEGQFIYDSNYNYTSNSRGNVSLSRAELDIVAEVGRWLTGDMIISYDDSANKVANGSITRMSNSRLRLDRGWITIGRLNKFPLYFTLGQVYAPFGKYGSFMVTDPVTKVLGRVKDRMAVLGYINEKYGIYAQAYGLAGETKYQGGSEIAKHSGINLGYNYERDIFKAHAGVGVIGNLAESEGCQKILGTNTAYETIYDRVLGYDGHIKVDINNFDIVAEYVTASKAFDPRNIAFNGAGAKPQALDLEGAYSFKIKNMVNTTFVGYNWTNQALAFNLPKQSYFAGYSIAVIKNTLASIEYRHNVNYGWGDSALLPDGSTISVNNGRHENLVTVQLGIYF